MTHMHRLGDVLRQQHFLCRYSLAPTIFATAACKSLLCNALTVVFVFPCCPRPESLRYRCRDEHVSIPVKSNWTLIIRWGKDYEHKTSPNDHGVCCCVLCRILCILSPSGAGREHQVRRTGQTAERHMDTCPRDSHYSPPITRDGIRVWLHLSAQSPRRIHDPRRVIHAGKTGHTRGRNCDSCD